MCGIAGFTGEAPTGAIEAMCRRIAHRGPDARGIVRKDHVTLGHTRLSIVDLETGRQPMETIDGHLAVVFNGEIYNHAELRRKLESRGHRFLTDHSDTEVLLHGYREWGSQMPSHLNGMWAFALHDRTRKRLFLSRDRFGKKPLYYSTKPGGFLFASELKALLAHPSAPTAISPLHAAKLFAYNFIPGPGTIITGVHKLPGGYSLEYDITSGRLECSRYWEFLPCGHVQEVTKSNQEEFCAQLISLLDAAVKRRLMADVPLGIFLSGGIDSSLIAALAARHVTQMHTFSVGFNEPSFDESRYARLMAAYLSSRHHEEMLDLETARKLLPHILGALDEPNADASILPTALLARFASASVKVALGGDGGDELFAGYDPFKALRSAVLYERFVPEPVHRGLRSAATWLPVSDANISFDFKINRTLRGLSHPAEYRLPVWMGPLDPTEIERLMETKIDAMDLYSEAVRIERRFANLDPVTRASHFFARLYMQDSVLSKVDRATMMHGLEARAPFLDVTFAEFAATIPSSMKLHGKTTKYILKQAARKLLPAEIVNRPKKGFGMPVAKWTASEDFCPQEIPGLSFNVKWARQLWEKHRLKKANYGMFLWAYRVLTEWAKSVSKNCG